MGGCSVRGCSNSHGKGYLMRSVPRDKQRREIWLKAINRPSLTSSPSAAVCEIHFDANSWEKVRTDGKRKLKLSAIPTLFLNNTGKKQRDRTTQSIESCIEAATPKPAAKQDALKVPNNIDIRDTNLTELHTSDTCNVSDVRDVRFSPAAKQDALKVPSNIDVRDTNLTEPHTSDNRDVKFSPKRLLVRRNTSVILSHDHNLCNNILRKYQMRLNLLKKRLKLSRAENKRLLATASDGTALKRIFNDDQIEILQNQHRKCKKWSNETLQRALKLRLACGNIGYNELRRQKFPFPSLRTLSNKVKQMKFAREIRDEINVSKLLDEVM